MSTAGVRRAAVAAWNGPFYIGPLSRPVSTGDALMKLLETAWRMLIALGAGVLLVGVAIAAFAMLKSTFEPAPLRSKIFGFAAIAASGCSKAYPMEVRLNNASGVSVGAVDFHIATRQAGRSTDLSPGYADWQSDYVIPPGKTAMLCYAKPVVKDPTAAGPFDYSVEVNSVYEYGP